MPSPLPHSLDRPRAPDPHELLRSRLTTLAKELLERAGSTGVSVGDLRYSAENRGLLTGEESEAFMNALRLGQVMRNAGGISTGLLRRSKVKKAKYSPNAVYVTREFAGAA